MNAMILAAGLGERLRPHTAQRAKPSLPFLNIPLIGFSYFYLNQLNPEQIVINTHHAPNSIKESVHQISEWIRSSYPLFCPQTIFTEEQPHILGSGGGIKLAEKYLRGKRHFLVANGDEVILSPLGLKKFWQDHCHREPLATLLVSEHEEVGTRFGGVWVNDKNEVIGFGKQTFPQSIKGYHFTGFMALSDRIFEFMPTHVSSNILYDILTKAIQSKEKIHVFQEDLNWYETGSEKDFLFATSRCLEQLENKNSIYGICLHRILTGYFPYITEWRKGIWIGKNCQIDPGTVFHSPCLIGNNVIIEKNVELGRYVVIGDKVHLKANTKIAESVIGADLMISSSRSISHQLFFK